MVVHETRDPAGAGAPDGGFVEVKLELLLNPRFLTEHSTYGDFDSFATESGLFARDETPHEVLASPEWDAWVRAQTDFDGWPEMLDRAKEALVDAAVAHS